MLPKNIDKKDTFLVSYIDVYGCLNIHEKRGKLAKIKYLIKKKKKRKRTEEVKREGRTCVNDLTSVE